MNVTDDRYFQYRASYWTGGFKGDILRSFIAYLEDLEKREPLHRMFFSTKGSSPRIFPQALWLLLSPSRMLALAFVMQSPRLLRGNESRGDLADPSRRRR